MVVDAKRLRVEEAKRHHPPRSAVVATVMRAGLTSAVWSIMPSDRNPPVHAFLVTKGTATFAQAHAATLDLCAPALLWLPSGARGVFRLEAGSEGFACTVAEDLVWRTLGDNPLLSTLRPFLDRIALASGERLAVCLGELETGFAALVREARGAQAGATAMMGFHLGLLRRWAASCRRRGHAGRCVDRFHRGGDTLAQGVTLDPARRGLGESRHQGHGARICRADFVV